MGADNDDIAAVLSTFTGAKHRLQYVTTLDGCKVIMILSQLILKQHCSYSIIKQPEVLIAGGLDRGFTFDDLVPLFKKHVSQLFFMVKLDIC